ncbi:MAG: PhzF family phenazine biosynthesis isomerase [Bdellovibrionota bacterium]
MIERVVGVDAFCGGGTQGNLAGVFISKEPLSDNEMQHIAKEYGASETAFVSGETAPFPLRWFTPTTEVALCGHGTLAAAFLMWQRSLVDKSKEISFSTKSGILTTLLLPDDKISMCFPALSFEPTHAAVNTMRALGISKPLYVGVSKNYLLVEVESEELLVGLNPNFVDLKKDAQRGFLITTQSRRAPYDFISRCFFPKEGIPEDPVTGSAHCVLGPYWKRKLAKDSLLAYQASKAGGELGIHFESTSVILAGEARFSIRR